MKNFATFFVIKIQLKKAYGYFEWCDKNPSKRLDIIKSGEKVGMIVEVPMQRPYSIDGLCVHIGIGKRTFDLYAQRENFMPVTMHVREIIEANRLEGVIVGLYKENIIARKLGLADKRDLTSDGEGFLSEIEIKL